MEGTMTYEEFELQAQSLLLKGYAADAPSAGARQIDGNVANTTECEVCGCMGHYYRPFYNAEEHSYLAYAVCANCTNVVEF
jgi:hypothetical protein